MQSVSAVARSKPRAIVLSHYMYPDDLVSARHFDGLCEGLVQRGWDVEAWPCNRGCRDETKTYPPYTEWNGIRIRRVARPRFPQASFPGRIANSAWMLMVWNFRLMFHGGDADVLIIGSDPIMSMLLAIPVGKFRAISIVHWCFDLYPEAAIADGILPANGIPARLLRWLLSSAYRSCKLIVDLGQCMRRKIDAYGHGASAATLVPWALVEPQGAVIQDLKVKESLFGSPAVLGCLYSGNFGRAHSYEHFLTLARELQKDDVQICFSVRGNCEKDLHMAIEKARLSNLRTAPFASESDLSARLGAADVHLVSLHESWTGTVVPSKFFGCLAAGRPVVFAGSSDSAVSKWIEEYQVGWVLTRDTVSIVAEKLRELGRDRLKLQRLQAHCHAVYTNHFAKEKTLDSWDALLRKTIIGNERRR